MTRSLRPYQDEDVQRMADILQESQAVFNLNEQRTGKLIEFIGLCSALYDSRPYALIGVVAPLTTLWNVQDEFATWLGWPVQINPTLTKADLRDHRDNAGTPLVVAVNKERLRDKDWWGFDAPWSLVLLDEAHHFRGRNAQQTKGAFHLARQADNVVLATGTPLMNGLPKELWPLLHMQDRQRWRSFWKYMAEYAVPLPGWGGAYQDENAPWKLGSKEALRAYMAPFSLRRTYREVNPQMPPVVEHTQRINLAALDPEHWRLYEQMARDWEATLDDTTVTVFTKLARSLRLRQLAASPVNLGLDRPGGKVAAIVEYAADLQGKAVIFCWHKAMVDALYDALPGPKFRVTGDDPIPARADACRLFQGDSRPSRLVATIGALKEGISLDRANTLIFAEKSWVPSENEQAASRILGPQQTGSPLVVSFVAERTIEEHMERVLAKKGAIASEFLAFTTLLEELHAA